jgi:alpha-L-fucosidase
VSILEGVGRWMGRNGASVHGAGGADRPKPEWGRFTRRGTTHYAHWMYRGSATSTSETSASG